MSLTLREAIDETMTRVSLAAGADVQTYAEEQVVKIIQNKFDLLFGSYWWPQFYNPGEAFTLDGATGVVTADITDKIKRFMDIRHVWLGTEPYPLPRLNTRSNPTNVTRRCISPVSGGKIFKLFPVTTTGTVTVAYRTYPDPFENDDDTIDMDTQLIVLGSAYDYLNSLGTNPEEEAKLLNFFNAQLKMQTDAIEGMEVSQGSYEASSLNGWQDDPRYPS